MKNTLSISIGEQCHCECLDCVNDGTNAIYVWVNVPKEDTSPKIDIYKSGVLIGSKPLESDLINNVKVLDDFTGFEESQVKLQYISNDRKGKYFAIQFPKELDGDLMLKQQDEYFYNAKFTVPKSGSYILPPTTTTTLGGCIVGENIEVTENGTISVPKVTELENQMQEVFISVSNGKKAIASAITDKGVKTESDATFAVMAENISKIKTGQDTSEYVDFPNVPYDNYVVLTCTGRELNSMIKRYVLGNENADYTDIDYDFDTIKFTNTQPSSSNSYKITEFSPYIHCICVGDASLWLYMVENTWTGDVSLVFYGENCEKVLAPVDARNMFERFYGITGEIDFSWLDTRICMSMNNMFLGFGFKYMTKLSLGDCFYTHNVLYYEGMFASCGKEKMTQIDLGIHFETLKAVSMYNMFNWCGVWSMSEIDLGAKFTITSLEVLQHGGNFFNRTITVYCNQQTADILNGITNVTAIVKYT